MVHSALPYSLGADDNGNPVLPTDSQIETFLDQAILLDDFNNL